MFFRKKSKSSDDTNVAKQWIQKMDAVVTGVILSGIVASIYGVKKLREREEHATEHTTTIDTPSNNKKWFFSKFFNR